MIHKVQVMSDEEAERYNQWQSDLDDVCDKIKLYICCCLLIFLFVYVIVLVITSMIYFQELKGIDFLVLPNIRDYVRHAFHLFVCRVDDRKKFMSYLEENKIASGIHYPISLSRLKAYKYLGQAEEDFVSHKIDNQIVSIPIGDHLTRDDAKFVSNVIKNYKT